MTAKPEAPSFFEQFSLKVKRREFLGILSGILTLILTAPIPRRYWQEIGDLPDRKGWSFLSGYWVIREDHRIAVCEGTCPHWGCRIHPTAEGFRCPCHGSLFGQDGKRLEGPSPRSIFWFKPSLRQGKLWIDLKPRPHPVWLVLGAPR
jgi:Rieske Fe-S protein